MKCGGGSGGNLLADSVVGTSHENIGHCWLTGPLDLYVSDRATALDHRAFGVQSIDCRCKLWKLGIVSFEKMIEQQLASTEGQLMQLEEMVRTASHNPTKQCLRLPNL